MKEWYSAKELVSLPGMPGTIQGVLKRVESWESRPRQGKGGGREYHISSLPEETRAHLLAEAASLPFSDPDLDAYLTSRQISLSPAELQDPAIQAKIACARAVPDRDIDHPEW